MTEQPSTDGIEVSQEQTRLFSPRQVGTVSLVMFLVSFFLPGAVFSLGSEVHVWPGYQCAFTSILGPLLLQFEGFANIFYPSALALFWAKFYRPAAIVGGISVLCALQTLSLFFYGFPQNEGGVGPYYYLKTPHIGYFLWLLSMIVLVVYSLQPRLRRQR